jgi:Putative peptidoglycan binding domain
VFVSRFRLGRRARRITVVGVIAASVTGGAVIATLHQASASTAGGTISRSEVISRAHNWWTRSLRYNSSRAAGTLVTDVDGGHKYGPDCSGMVSMAWHLNPGKYGGLNTSTLPSAGIAINRNDLQMGDLLDDTIDGHAVLFEGWKSDHVHFTYYSFGSTPMRHYDGGGGSNEGPLGTFASGAKIASHPASHYSAYRYKNITGGSTPPPPPSASWPTVKQGATGERVKSVQYLLNRTGAGLSVDGNFGSATATAVRNFQKSHGLGVDGVVGSQTWPALAVTVAQGDTGDAVRALQSELSAHGYATTVDGNFGSGTNSSVRAFQSHAGIGVDGVAGPITWRYLVS